MRPLAPLLAFLLVAAAPPQSITDVQAIDFALDWKTYIGRRVRITGAQFYTASVKSGAVALPGAMAYVDFDGVPRATLKHLITRCSPPTDRQECTLAITADIKKNQFFDEPQLVRVLIDDPAAPP